MQIRTIKVAEFGISSGTQPIAQQISLPCEPWEKPSQRTTYQLRPEFWRLVEKLNRNLTETPKSASVIARSMRAKTSDVSRALYYLAERVEPLGKYQRQEKQSYIGGRDAAMGKNDKQSRFIGRHGRSNRCQSNIG